MDVFFRIADTTFILPQPFCRPDTLPLFQRKDFELHRVAAVGKVEKGGNIVILCPLLWKLQLDKHRVIGGGGWTIQLEGLQSQRAKQLVIIQKFYGGRIGVFGGGNVFWGNFGGGTFMHFHWTVICIDSLLTTSRRQENQTQSQN